MPTGRPRHSVWEVCKTIEIQLKGFCHVPPLNNDSLLDDLATMRDLFVKEIGAYIWSAQEHYAHKYPRTRDRHSTINKSHPSFHQAALSQRNQIFEGLCWGVSTRQQNCSNNWTAIPWTSSYILTMMLRLRHQLIWLSLNLLPPSRNVSPKTEE